MQLAPRQRGFEHIASIHGAIGLARAHHGVQFINKNNGLALVLGQFSEYIFQALFKFATVFGARQKRRHIQREHALAFQTIGHFARHNALRQAFNNGGFAHTRLADQHGIVFGAALQHLNGTADFIVAAYHGVELADARALGQV